MLVRFLPETSLQVSLLPMCPTVSGQQTPERVHGLPLCVVACVLLVQSTFARSEHGTDIHQHLGKTVHRIPAFVTQQECTDGTTHSDVSGVEGESRADDAEEGSAEGKVRREGYMQRNEFHFHLLHVLEQIIVLGDAPQLDLPLGDVVIDGTGIEFAFLSGGLHDALVLLGNSLNCTGFVARRDDEHGSVDGRRTRCLLRFADCMERLIRSSFR